MPLNQLFIINIVLNINYLIFVIENVTSGILFCIKIAAYYDPKSVSGNKLVIIHYQRS